MASDVCSSTVVNYVAQGDLPKTGLQLEHSQEVGDF
jgi:hypothetical protein